MAELDGLRPAGEMTHDELKERQEVPAYLRKGVKLKQTPKGAGEPAESRTKVGGSDMLGDNRFLHDNVD